MKLDGLALLPRTLMDEARTMARSGASLDAITNHVDTASTLLGDVISVTGVKELSTPARFLFDAGDAFRAGNAELGALHLDDAIHQFDAIAGVLALFG